MASVNLSAMLPEVRPSVSGCPEPVMINAIRNAAIKLCELSFFWETQVDPLVMLAGIAEYEIDQPMGQRIIRINKAIGSRGVLAFRTEADMDAVNPLWRDRSGDGVSAPVMVNPRLIRMYPVPLSGGEQIDLRAIVKPSPISDVIEDYVYDDFYTGIAAGAIASLCAMPGKEWTNFDLVAYYKKIFNDDVFTAKARVAKGYSGALSHIRPARLGMG